MKQITLLLTFLLFSVVFFAQTPFSFKYQVVLRSGDGNVLSEQNVGLRITILQGDISGETVYEETFSSTTNEFGLVNLEIGTGQNQTGEISAIDWSQGPYFIKTGIDITGGTSYTDMGTSQLLSVPYALHANTVNSESICDLFSFYYLDSDGDNYGYNGSAVFSCYPPEGYVPDNTDCNDGDGNINPGAAEICDGIDNNCNGQNNEGLSFNTYFFDKDLDGFGDPLNSIDSCIQPAGYVMNDLDCNDDDPEINPDASEICDGVDNNCNGQNNEGLTDYTYYFDSDKDGFGDQLNSVDSCQQPDGYVANDLDCNDDDPGINPDASEICDGVDNNCNGQNNEGLTFMTYYLDSDDDGFGDPLNSVDSCQQPDGYVANDLDCNDSDPGINPNIPEVCNGIDDNCNGGIDDELEGGICMNTNEYGTCEGVFECLGEQGWECNASTPAEEMCNGTDDNCNGQIDEGFPDSDNDSMADCVDDDTDGDDISNVVDNCPTVYNPDQTDSDDDGVGDLCECLNNNDCDPGYSCVDGECIVMCTPDCSMKACGSDGCGGSCGSCPSGYACYEGWCYIDSDGDGNADIIDIDIDGDGVLNDVDCNPNDPILNFVIGDPCDDGNLCTYNDTINADCDCVGIPIDCAPYWNGNECTPISCNPATGDCVHTVLDCDDQDPCTIDDCDPVAGCIHTQKDCDDGDPNTIDYCVDGECHHDAVK